MNVDITKVMKFHRISVHAIGVIRKVGGTVNASRIVKANEIATLHRRPRHAQQEKGKNCLYSHHLFVFSCQLEGWINNLSDWKKAREASGMV